MSKAKFVFALIHRLFKIKIFDTSQQRQSVAHGTVSYDKIKLLEGLHSMHPCSRSLF